MIKPISLHEGGNILFPFTLSVGLAFCFCRLSYYFTASQLQGCFCFVFFMRLGMLSQMSAEAAVMVASHLVQFSSLLVGAVMAQSSCSSVPVTGGSAAVFSVVW